MRTSAIPVALNLVSVETMRTTPDVIMKMIPTSRQDGVSRRKRKANMRTKAREDDLHIAGDTQANQLRIRCNF